MAETFGERIRVFREEKLLLQVELAQAAGCSRSYLARIEADDVEPPAAALVGRLAKALGEDRDELMRLAGRIPADVRRVLLDTPGLFRELRRRRRPGARAAHRSSPNKAISSPKSKPPATPTIKSRPSKR